MTRNTKYDPEKANEPLPATLCSLMKAFGTKSVTLANYLGVSGTAIANYRNGIDKPDWKTIVKIADFFHVTTDFLLGRQQAPFFESPDMEDIGFSEQAAFVLKSLATNRALENDPEGFFHKIFNEFNSFIASPQFYILFSLLYTAKEAAASSSSRLEELLQDNGTPEEAENEYHRFKSVYATEEVKSGYMYARYQIDRQVKELLDDYLGDKGICTKFKQLEQKMVHQQKEQKARKKANRNKKEDVPNGEHSQN